MTCTGARARVDRRLVHHHSGQITVRAETQQLAVAHKRTLQDVWMKAQPQVNRQALVDRAAADEAAARGAIVLADARQQG